jgi:predicted ArsR family transcriptional regulator
MSRCGRKWKREGRRGRKVLDEKMILSLCNGVSCSAIARSVDERPQTIKPLLEDLESRNLVRREFVKLSRHRGRPTHLWTRVA